MLMRTGTEVLRISNRALILACLRDIESAAHTDFMDWTDLASGTVSVITNELMEEGAIGRVEMPPPSGRGRPRAHFKINPDFAKVSIVRVAGDRVEYSLIDYAGRIQDRFEEIRPPEETDAEVFFERFEAGLARQCERGGFERSGLKVISITTKGLVSPTRDSLLWSPVFETQRIDFRKRLEANWSAKVILTNETLYSALTNASRMDHPKILPGQRHAILSLGHSVGFGLASFDAQGKLTSQAPPFGHMVHLPDGPLCRCGSHGCIEAFAGFYGILRTAFDVKGDVKPANFIPDEQIDRVAADARIGDRRSEYAFRLAGEALGIGLSRLVSLFGAMSITVTGRGVRNFDLLEPGFRAPLADNLQIRFAKSPEIRLERDETQMIYDGNVKASLRELDETLVATRLIGEA